jgi:hypothetical protein
MATKRKLPDVSERKKLHAELARRPELKGKIAEAKVDYKKVLASGGLHRFQLPASNL